MKGASGGLIQTKTYRGDGEARSPPSLAFGAQRSKISPGLFLASASTKHAGIQWLLTKIGRLWPDDEFGYSSIHVIKSFETSWHQDALNIDCALALSVGTFSNGGCLAVGGHMAFESGYRIGYIITAALSQSSLALLTIVILSASSS